MPPELVVHLGERPRHLDGAAARDPAVSTRRCVPPTVLSARCSPVPVRAISRARPSTGSRDRSPAAGARRPVRSRAGRSRAAPPKGSAGAGAAAVERRRPPGLAPAAGALEPTWTHAATRLRGARSSISPRSSARTAEVDDHGREQHGHGHREAARGGDARAEAHGSRSA